MKADFFKKYSLYFMLALIFLSQGCVVKEAAKRVAGNSTQVLMEEARVNAISQAFYCSYQDCFDAVKLLAKENSSDIPWVKLPNPNEGDFSIFMSDLYANPPYIIVMGIPGNVDTTEVGIFFNRTTHETIRVDVSSLSSTAKRRVAELVFAHLARAYQKAE